MAKMTKPTKKEIEKIIKYYSLGDKKGDRTDLALNDCVNALFSLFQQAINQEVKRVLEKVREELPLEGNYDDGAGGGFKMKERVETILNWLKKELEEK